MSHDHSYFIYALDSTLDEKSVMVEPTQLSYPLPPSSGRAIVGINSNCMNTDVHASVSIDLVDYDSSESESDRTSEEVILKPSPSQAKRRPRIRAGKYHSACTARHAGTHKSGQRQKTPAHALPSPKKETFWSITSNPALQDTSFEELRLECYLQSRVAGRDRPFHANPNMPWMTIAPGFQPSDVMVDLSMKRDTVMADSTVASTSSSAFTFRA